MRNILLALALLSPVIASAAGPQVEIVVREKAPALERKAGEEIAACLKRLYSADASVVTAAAGGKDAIYVNPPSPAPKPDKQSFSIKSTNIAGRQALVISGGSPAAVYWAAAEFQHQLGVRSFLFGDLDPIAPPAFSLEKWDISAQAEFPVRGWRLAFEDPAGPQGWSGEELAALVGQLAKLKFNRLLISVADWQPFVHFEAEGVKKETGVLWRGQKFPVSGDTAGRTAFRGARFFENPVLASATNYSERVAAGEKHMLSLIASAQMHGMSVGLIVNPWEYPPEFASLTPDPAKRYELARVQLRAYASAYPALDAFYLSSGTDPIATKKWLAALKSDSTIGERSGGGRIPIFVEAENELVEDSRVIPVVTLAATSAGFLPHTVLHADDEGFSGGVKKFSTGFVTRSQCLGDLDFPAYYLSRMAFGSQSTPVAASDEMLTPVCGEEVAGRVVKALGLVNRATELISGNSPDFAQPGPEMVLKHYANAEPPPAWLTEAKTAYLNAMNEMYRANTRSRDGGRAFTLYLARRYEFGFEYLNCVEAVRKAAVAKKNGDAAMQAAELQKAVESMNGGLSALAAVTRSSSDRATIAWLNEYGYRPLVKALEEAEDAQ